MLAVIGNKTLEISNSDLQKIINKYEAVHIDIGTGDGRYVYKKAVENPVKFFIGVDPSQKQLEIYSKKALRQKVKNVMFVLGSIGLFPGELSNLANKVTIILPWGSLLGSLVLGDTETLTTLKNILKKNATLLILFGYSHEAEPSEVHRLELDKLTIEHIHSKIVPNFVSHGLELIDIQELTKSDLKKFETTWSKRLVFGQHRPLFLLEFKKLPVTLY